MSPGSGWFGREGLGIGVLFVSRFPNSLAANALRERPESSIPCALQTALSSSRPSHFPRSEGLMEAPFEIRSAWACLVRPSAMTTPNSRASAAIRAFGSTCRIESTVGAVVCGTARLSEVAARRYTNKTIFERPLFALRSLASARYRFAGDRTMKMSVRVWVTERLHFEIFERLKSHGASRLSASSGNRHAR